MNVLGLVGAILAVLGSLFLFLAALGILRMPDVYNRMQAGTKATTLGTMLFLIGMGLIHPAWLPKSIILVLFVVFTNPISSHALARAAHNAGIPMTDRSITDALAESRPSSNDSISTTATGDTEEAHS